MKKENEKYFEIKNKYLAETLAWFGFKYYKFNNKKTGKNIYSFADTKEIRELKNRLITMKLELNNKR